MNKYLLLGYNISKGELCTLLNTDKYILLSFNIHESYDHLINEHKNIIRHSNTSDYNSGYYLFPINTLLDVIKDHKTNYKNHILNINIKNNNKPQYINELLEHYTLHSRSFDKTNSLKLFMLPSPKNNTQLLIYIYIYETCIADSNVYEDNTMLSLSINNIIDYRRKLDNYIHDLIPDDHEEILNRDFIHILSSL